MDSLLPFILLIALSVILSQKKKKKQSEEESTESYPQESPWDDFFPEKKEPELPHSSTVQTPASTTSEKTNSVSVEPTTVAPPFSYESEWQPEVSALDDLEESSSLESVLLSAKDFELNVSSGFFEEVQGQKREQSDGYAKNETAEQPVSAEEKVFPTGFDLRQAVLYSEIMKPRFLRDY